MSLEVEIHPDGDAVAKRGAAVPNSPPAVLTTELGDLSGAMGAAVLAGG